MIDVFLTLPTIFSVSMVSSKLPHAGRNHQQWTITSALVIWSEIEEDQFSSAAGSCICDRGKVEGYFSLWVLWFY